MTGSGQEPVDEGLRLETEKVQLERDKLRLEKSKSIWTSLSILGPLLVAMAAIMGPWVQRETADTQLLIKMAEIVLDAESPNEAKARAEMLAAFFAERLPRAVSRKFPEIDPVAFGSRKDRTAEPRKELVRLLADKPQQRDQILRDWQALFPEDKWPAVLGGDSSSVSKHP